MNKRHSTGLGFLVGMCALLLVAALPAQPLNLGRAQWLFKQGDDLQWAHPQHPDQDWQRIEVGLSWESATGKAYDGWAWYRKAFVVPASLEPMARQNGGLVLKLGQIDDADETFLNGNLVGSTGQFPPASVSAWDKAREYHIPAELVRWGELNVVAVRVNDWGGGGGLHAGDYQLEPRSWKNSTDLVLSNASPTQAYPAGTPPAIRVQVANNFSEGLQGRLSCQIRTFSAVDCGLPQSQPIELAVGEQQSTSFSVKPLPPGFYQAVVTITDSLGNTLQDRLGFAVAPEEVAYQTSRPADFETFWANAKAELAAVKPNYKLIPDPVHTTAAVDVFIVEMRSLNNALIRGYYAQPKGKTNLPAMLHVQGYGTNMQPYDLENTDFAQFFLNIRGHGNSKDDVNPGMPGYLQAGIESPQTYIYRGAYMDCIRAVDFLCTRSEVDATRIGVMGSSQGGALSVATAALDPRIKLCMPDVPFLSDFRLYFQLARWPANEFVEYQRRSRRSWDDIHGVLDYFDIKNLAPNISCPVLMGVGLFDDVCPPASNFAMYNLLTTPAKAYYLYPQSGHGLPAEQYAYRKEWMRALLR